MKLKNILREATDPSKSIIQICKTVFTSYAHTTNNKTSLIKLWKYRHNPFISNVLKDQDLDKINILYRGIKQYEQHSYRKGEVVNFFFDGWSKNKTIAISFSYTEVGTPILFVMKNPNKNIFFDLKLFGDSLQKNIKKLRPEHNFDNRDLSIVYKKMKTDPLLFNLNELYDVCVYGKYGRGEEEVVTFPVDLPIKNIEKENELIMLYV